MSLSDETRAAVKKRQDERGGTYRQALEFVMADREAAKWNAKHPVGTPCTVQFVTGGPKVETRTRSAAWVISGHASVMVEGKSGGYGLEWVKPIRAVTP